MPINKRERRKYGTAKKKPPDNSYGKKKESAKITGLKMNPPKKKNGQKKKARKLVRQKKGTAQQTGQIMNSAKKVNGQNRQRPKNGIGQLKPPAKKGAMAEKKERLKKKKAE
jgi:hypothetical protein